MSFNKKAPSAPAVAELVAGDDVQGIPAATATLVAGDEVVPFADATTAVAVAVAAAPAAAAAPAPARVSWSPSLVNGRKDLVSLNLPGGKNYEQLKIMFEGKPARLTFIDTSILQSPMNPTGFYVYGIRVSEGMEVTNCYDGAAVQKILALNSNVNHRQLLLGPQPPRIMSDDGLYYVHRIPTGDNIGLDFDGFPPKVAAVHSGPLQGRAHAGQQVAALIIPDVVQFNLRTPGFTGTRIKQELANSWKIEGRQLVLKDVRVHRKFSKGGDQAIVLQDCTIM